MFALFVFVLFCVTDPSSEISHVSLGPVPLGDAGGGIVLPLAGASGAIGTLLPGEYSVVIFMREYQK